MRVVGGIYRGRKLVGFDGCDIRPTADRVKENLFNIIGGGVVGKRFLDAFCGTGAMGIEALSRGAAEAVFLDNSEKSAALAEKNFSKLGISARVTRADTIGYLKRTENKFDIIFIDPPYASDFGVKALEVIGSRGLLGESGFAVFEHEEPFCGEIESLSVYDERKYGRVYLTFFGRLDR